MFYKTNSISEKNKAVYYTITHYVDNLNEEIVALSY